MTREEAKEWLPVIQAFAEGKTIEYSNQGEPWVETDCPLWRSNCEYRIKPEPKYRPFKTKEECWNEMLKHQPFGWLRNTYTKRLHNIGSIGATYSIEINNSKMYFDVAFDAYTFVDGTPFGIMDD